MWASNVYKTQGIRLNHNIIISLLFFLEIVPNYKSITHKPSSYACSVLLTSAAHLHGVEGNWLAGL